MEIIAHRGLWQASAEKNSWGALTRALEIGLGIETDIRDANGTLVVSHDPPLPDALAFDELLAAYVRGKVRPSLALNIKADGLHHLLKASLNKFKIDNYFVFDASVPDLLGYIRQNFQVFTRQSEHEAEPALIHQAAGVWMDELEGSWIREADILAKLKIGKRVCLVSPELHGRSYHEMWEAIKPLAANVQGGLLALCTDHPLEAREYFQ